MNDEIRRGRPTRYTIKLPLSATEYIKNCLKDNKFPTIEGLAQYLGISARTIYDWEKVHVEFLQTIDTLRDTQKQLLITNGLTGGYNSRFAMFLLKANHGMTEKEPTVDATQNNYMGISPDLLADALRLMHSQEARE